MKYLKKKKRSPLPWIVALLALVLVGLILVLSLLPGGDQPAAGDETTVPTGETQHDQTTAPSDGTAPTGGSSSQETTGPAQESTEEPTVAPTYAPIADVRIETPYATLTYPGEWGGLLQVDKINGDPYKVIFTANLDSGIQQELFTISFGGSRDGALGVLKVSGREVFVHVHSVDFQPGADWSANEISVIYSMQEALNDVLAALSLTTPQVPQETQPETLPPENDEDMVIDTPCGELHYPARWSSYLKVEIRQTPVCAVDFYCQLEGFADQLLFTVHFGGEEGIYVTDFTCSDGSTVALRVSLCEIEPNVDWTDAQRVLVLAMQEDMNYLLMALME